MMISQAAVDLIVASEVTSRAVYEKKYTHPEWPGGMSGITIAIGYDVGYANAAKLKADWTGRIPVTMINALVPCCGVHGNSAQAILSSVRSIVNVPWVQAMDVFLKVDEQEWIAKVCKAIPGADKLSPDCLGALVSLAYNRGPSFTIPASQDPAGRYQEMRNIRALIMAGKLDQVAQQFRAMKRLWGPSQSGLWARRDAEAALWNKGLISVTVQPERKTNETPPPLIPSPPAGTAEGSSTGGIVVGTGTVVATAASHGLSGWAIAGIIVVGFIVLTGVLVAIRNYRTQPVVAREKDMPV